MLIDVSELPGNSQIDCDVCIAGAGPAGLTLAAELAGTSLQLCLVESGGLSPRGALPSTSVAEQLGLLVDAVKFQQHSLGGASHRWGGLLGRWFRLKPMDPIDFEARPWVPNSGWPFGHAELEPYLRRACGVLQLSPDCDFSPLAQRAHLSPEFHNEDLETAIFLMTRPVRFGERYRGLLASFPNVRAYLNAHVIEIEEDAGSPLIRCLHVAAPDGRTHRITARHFVLACGGFENPRLLLVSRRKAAAGIGNQHDQVGRYYMQHPRGLHGFLCRRSGKAPLYTAGYVVNGVAVRGAIRFSDQFQRREGVLNHCIMLRPMFALSEGHASRIYRILRRAWRRDGDGRHEFSDLARLTAAWLKRALRAPGGRRVFSVLNHMEQVPRPESRVDLSTRTDRFGIPQLRIDWHIDPLEKVSLDRLHRLVQARLALHEAGRLESELDPLANDWPIREDSAHHLGTTRMHADPRRGVVDGNGRVHGLGNLYITGNSVLPTSGYANPTLTIIALAIRLADHLKQLPQNRPD